MDRLRKIRDEYLPNPPPASTALIVAALAKPEWLFELDAVAARQAQGGM
jgi:enamine deaminase RidA (YjgF/YER057c/UK114 family)